MKSHNPNGAGSDWAASKKSLIRSYREKLNECGDVPEAIQMSKEGQLFRFAKLSEIGNLTGKRVLDVGCGRADLYPYLKQKFGQVDYVGIDLVPELVQTAREKYSDAVILCHDLFQNDLEQSFDYVFISMVLNNKISNMERFWRELLRRSFALTRIAMGFNFVSSYVNFANPQAINHNPAEILDFCLSNLSTKTSMYHHYERCDVAVFVYK